MLEIFRQWPQAVSADEGDLRILHDMANAGAQLWGTSLPWPDYLWLDFDDRFPQAPMRDAANQVYYVEAPGRSSRHATFAVTALRWETRSFRQAENSL